MLSVYFYFLPFLVGAILFLFFEKTKNTGIVLILSYIFLFLMSYFLHDHFYFWKNKNSERYIETTGRLICSILNRNDKNVENVRSILNLLPDSLLIKSKGSIVYENKINSIYSNRYVLRKENKYTCGNYNVYINIYNISEWYKTYFYYFRALLRGEVFSFSEHKYWDFAVLHFSLIMLFSSFILYRINVMQNNTLISIEKVIENI